MGGGYGIQLPSLPLPIWQTEVVFYFVFLAMAVIVIWCVRRMERSRTGLALLAIRNDEDVAEIFGVDVVRVKLKTFVASAFFPGVAGAIFAYQISYIDPHSAFDIGLSIDMLLMTMLGGAGRWAGPIVGATVVYLLSQTLSFVIPSELNRVVFGVISGAGRVLDAARHHRLRRDVLDQARGLTTRGSGARPAPTRNGTRGSKMDAYPATRSRSVARSRALPDQPRGSSSRMPSAASSSASPSSRPR